MPTSVTEAAGSVAPILVLIALGMLLRRGTVLDEATIDGLKRIIVSISLPAVLFSTFLSTTFQPQHGWVVASIFLVCVILLGLGFGYARLSARLTASSIPDPAPTGYMPYLFTGFELGMLGFALFTAVYGAAMLPALGVLALGHEVFIWFVYASMLRAASHQRQSPMTLLRQLATSPVIIAIVSGMALNLAGARGWLQESLPGTVLLTTLNYLSGIIVPAVLMIIGYGSKLNWAGVRQALPLVVTRLVVVIVLAYVVGEFVFMRALGLDRIYFHALVTLMLLPPPFIVPLFIPRNRRVDAEYSTNVLSLYSLASVAVFVTYVAASRALGLA